MADLERRSISALIDAVSAVIDMDITPNSSPTIVQVQQWLTDGAVRLFSLLPPEVLTDCIVSEQHTGVSILEEVIEHNVLRVVGVKLNGITCTKIEDEEFDALNLSPYKYTMKNPAYSVSKVDRSFAVRVFPGFSTNNLTLKYLPKPFSYVDADGLYPAGDRDYSVPATLEPLIVDFAAIMYRNQDEEPGQYQLYLTEWKEQVKLYFQLPSQNTEGSYS